MREQVDDLLRFGTDRAVFRYRKMDIVVVAYTEHSFGSTDASCNALEAAQVFQQHTLC